MEVWIPTGRPVTTWVMYDFLSRYHSAIVLILAVIVLPLARSLFRRSADDERT